MPRFIRVNRAFFFIYRFHYVSDDLEAPTSSEFWGEGEPNGISADCVKVTPAGKWNDVDCTAQADNQYALCQKEGDKGQLISECLFDNLKFSKKPKKIDKFLP